MSGITSVIIRLSAGEYSRRTRSDRHIDRAGWAWIERSLSGPER